MRSSGISKRSGKNDLVRSVADSLHALNGSDCIWCGRCDWKTTYTRGTPFYDSEFTPVSSSSPSFSMPIRSSVLPRSLAFCHCVSPLYMISSESLKQGSIVDFRLSGIAFPRQSMAQHRSMKHSKCVPLTKVKIHRGRVLPAVDLPKAGEPTGQETTEMN